MRLDTASELFLPGDGWKVRNMVEMTIAGDHTEHELERWCRDNCVSDYSVTARPVGFNGLSVGEFVAWVAGIGGHTDVSAWFRDPADADLFTIRWRS